MAKQTFTTGQVLTAAQMTSLQETAMGGGPATAKTASYVLVAADAGTTVAMNAAGATTITVNTGLFAAGDTVFIQNLGAGACTVTAGTATVATAGSLILPQNDAGILYFTSASAAIFYDYIQVGATSPLTTKGDIYVYGTSDTRLPVGANGTTLVADSAEATGLKWATPAAGGMTLLNTGGTALSGGTVTISSLSTSYKHLYLVVTNARTSVNSTDINFRLNGDSATKYGQGAIRNIGGTILGRGNPSNTSITEILMTTSGTTDTYQAQLQLWIPNYTITGGVGIHYQHYGYTGSSLSFYTGSAVYNNSAAITSISFIVASPDTLTAGTAYVYGVS